MMLLWTTLTVSVASGLETEVYRNIQNNYPTCIAEAYWHMSAVMWTLLFNTDAEPELVQRHWAQICLLVLKFSWLIKRLHR